MSLTALALLLLFQCIGEGVAHLGSIPVPGPVIGMVLMFIALQIFPRLFTAMEATSRGILQHLSLLFVPAGVGVIASGAQLNGDLTAIVVALVVSTVLAVAVGALVTNYAMRWQSRAGQRSED